MWITDKNGNKASTEYWGSEEAAKASLATLVNCKYCENCDFCENCEDCENCKYCEDCENCKYCKNCENCKYCKNCENCEDCKYCKNCENCENCNLSKEHEILQVNDPRGYTFIKIKEKNGWRIKAGCRDFSIQEAKDHWLSERNYRGPKEVQEFFKRLWI